MRILLPVFIFALSLSHSLTSYGCGFFKNISQKLVTTKVAVEFFKEDGSLEAALHCSSGSMQVDATENRFHFGQFLVVCAESNINAMYTPFIELVKGQGFYIDNHDRRLPVDIQCSKRKLAFSHNWSGTWVDPWPLGDYKWNLRRSGSSLLYSLIKTYSGRYMKVSAEF